MHFDDGEYNIPDLALRNERHQDALVDKTLGHVSLVISRSRDFGKFQGVPLPLEKSVLGKQYSNSQNMAIIIDIVRAKGLNPKEGQGILLDRVRTNMASCLLLAEGRHMSILRLADPPSHSSSYIPLTAYLFFLVPSSFFLKKKKARHC